jgi:hypothetical protein
MNKTQLFACVAGALVGVSALAQGTFAFGNTSGAKNKINLSADLGGAPIAGANYLVDVLVKNPTTGEFTNSGLLRVTAQGEVPTVPVVALTGNNVGLFTGGTVKVPFVAGGSTATVKVLAWDKTTGATYDAATIRGELTFDIASLGGVGSPPTLPAALGLPAGLTLAVIPEPSTYALAALGLGGLLLFRRK